MQQYFSHDLNARRDPKLVKLQLKFGLEGYAIYFQIIEILGEQKEYTYGINDIDALAYEFRREIDFIKEFLDFCFKVDLFYKKDDFFYSKSFKNRMEIKAIKQLINAENGKKGAKKRWKSENKNTLDEKNSQAMATLWPGYGHPMATPIAIDSNKSKLKETKVKESKEELKEKLTLKEKREERNSILKNPHFLKYAIYYKDFELKKQFSEFVYMQKKEFERLIFRFGEELTNEAIEKLNLWKLEKLEKKCFQDVRGDDSRKILKWVANSVIESWKKTNYKKYQNYIEKYEKQNSAEMREKMTELVRVGELTLENAKKLPTESIENIYKHWTETKLKNAEFKRENESQIEISSEANSS